MGVAYQRAGPWSVRLRTLRSRFDDTGTRQCSNHPATPIVGSAHQPTKLVMKISYIYAFKEYFTLTVYTLLC